MRIHDENASFRFNQKGLRKFLGDLECEIMELVWEKADPTVTVREIFNTFQHIGILSLEFHVDKLSRPLL